MPRDPEVPRDIAIPRRSFVAASLGGAVAAVAGCSDESEDSGGATASSTTAGTAPPPELSGDPFLLGVASGDPLADRVILWTRLRTEADDLPGTDIEVVWEVSADESFDDVVASGVATASDRWGHSVHVDAEGLTPATDYWYRFTVGDRTSAVGRTRTVAAEGVDPVRMGVCTCQGYRAGYYTAHRDMAEEDLDVVFFNGDFIYDFEASEVRSHGLGPPQSLEDYRALYEVGLRDADLAANRAAHPWIVTWDDHEVEDNYAGLVPGELSVRSGTAAEDFSERRAAAYQAWWEHQPVRTAEPDGADLPIYRTFRFGDLITMPVIDTRQYRDEQVKDGSTDPLDQILNYGVQTDAVFDEDRQMLGEEQEEWLLGEIAGAGTEWLVIGQQSIMGGWNLDPSAPGGRWSMDTWDGYVAQRARVLDALADTPAGGVVSVGGDLHHSVAQGLRLDPTAEGTEGTEVIGTELICPSISSGSSEGPEQQDALASPDYVTYYDVTRRGWMDLTLDEDGLRADMVYVDATVPDATAEVGASVTATADDPLPVVA